MAFCQEINCSPCPARSASWRPRQQKVLGERAGVSHSLSHILGPFANLHGKRRYEPNWRPNPRISLFKQSSLENVPLHHSIPSMLQLLSNSYESRSTSSSRRNPPPELPMQDLCQQVPSRSQPWPMLPRALERTCKFQPDIESGHTTKSVRSLTVPVPCTNTKTSSQYASQLMVKRHRLQFTTALQRSITVPQGSHDLV